MHNDKSALLARRFRKEKVLEGKFLLNSSVYKQCKFFFLSKLQWKTYKLKIEYRILLTALVQPSIQKTRRLFDNQTKRRGAYSTIKPKDEAVIQPSNQKTRLFNYQTKMTRWLFNHQTKRRALSTMWALDKISTSNSAGISYVNCTKFSKNVYDINGAIWTRILSLNNTS